MGQWMATRGPVCGAPREKNRLAIEETRLWRGPLGTSRLKLGYFIVNLVFA